MFALPIGNATMSNLFVGTTTATMASAWNPDPTLHDYSGPYPLAELEDARKTLIHCLRFPNTELLKRTMPKVGITTEYGPGLVPPPMFKASPPPFHGPLQSSPRQRFPRNQPPNQFPAANQGNFHHQRPPIVSPFTPPNSGSSGYGTAAAISGGSVESSAAANQTPRSNLISLTDKGEEDDDNTPVFFSHIQQKGPPNSNHSEQTTIPHPRKTLLPTPLFIPNNKGFQENIQLGSVSGVKRKIADTFDSESPKRNANNSSAKDTEKQNIMNILDVKQNKHNRRNDSMEPSGNSDAKDSSSSETGQWNSILNPIKEAHGGIPGLDLLPSESTEFDATQSTLDSHGTQCTYSNKADENLESRIPVIGTASIDLKKVKKIASSVEQLSKKSDHCANKDHLTDSGKTSKSVELQAKDQFQWSDIPCEEGGVGAVDRVDSKVPKGTSENVKSILTEPVESGNVPQESPHEETTEDKPMAVTAQEVRQLPHPKLQPGMKTYELWKANGMFGATPHDVQSILKCDTCNFACEVMEELNAHLQMCCHYSGSRYRVVVGSGNRIDLVAVEEMLVAVNNPGYFARQIVSCPECNDIFEDVFMCSIHSRRIHGYDLGCYTVSPVINEEVIDISAVPKCRACIKPFSKQADLNDHWKELPHHSPFKPTGNQSFVLYMCGHKNCKNITYDNVGFAINHGLTHIQKAASYFQKMNSVKVIMKEVLQPKMKKRLPVFDSEKQNGLVFEIEVLKRMKAFYTGVLSCATQKKTNVQLEIEKLQCLLDERK